jgi:hypothetical protein
MISPLCSFAGPVKNITVPQETTEDVLTENSADDRPSRPPILPAITITAAPEDRATGKSIISQELIEHLPTGNGSINELLDILPGVQFSDRANTSLQGGEILPPNLSISGGKTFQNNFLIDGIGNNSLLDPVSTSRNSVLDVPGHPQEIFLDSRLIGEVTIFRHNIPARFGGFTGGVVDSRTRNPEPVPGGWVFYRTTRDEWTRFHVDSDDRSDFENSHEASRQPEFTKHHTGLGINVPLGPKGGLLASFTELYSKISLNHLGESKEQNRRNENFFLKGIWNLSPDDVLSLSIVHAPYREERFKSKTKNSDFTIEGGGTAANASWDHIFAGSSLAVDAGFKTSENSRRAPSHHYSWLVLGEKDWGDSLGTTRSWEGGFGDIEKTQESAEARAEFTFPRMTTSAIEQEIAAGLEYAWAHGEFDRKETTLIFYLAVADSNVLCDQDSLGCVDNEQFFYKRTAYEADSVGATINNYAFYVEDQIDFGRLGLRPGLRLSYDDFMGNTNLAPRLAATYDLLGNRRTLLIAGWNRYYGKTLLTYKLREAQRPARTDIRSQTLDAENRPSAEWSSTYSTSATRFSDLKTPFADEAVLGLEQLFSGGRLNLSYVRRDGRDEFAREKGEIQPDGFSYHILNNNGRSRHEEYSLTWEGRWKRHYLSLNATYQETESSAEDYETILDAERREEPVWYDGDIVKREDLPRQDFNRPWVANLLYSVQLPYGFAFTNFTKYRSGFQALEIIKKSDWPTLDIPEEVGSAYREEKQPESWVFDWKIDWRRNMFRDQALLLSLEINNVFNKKVPVGGEDAEFEIGRQFWAGAEYLF